MKRGCRMVRYIVFFAKICSSDEFPQPFPLYGEFTHRENLVPASDWRYCGEGCELHCGESLCGCPDGSVFRWNRICELSQILSASFVTREWMESEQKNRLMVDPKNALPNDRKITGIDWTRNRSFVELIGLDVNHEICVESCAFKASITDATDGMKIINQRIRLFCYRTLVIQPLWNQGLIYDCNLQKTGNKPPIRMIYLQKPLRSNKTQLLRLRNPPKTHPHNSQSTTFHLSIDTTIPWRPKKCQVEDTAPWCNFSQFNR